MIATALLTEPRLLLADEPTTALDVTTQAEVMAILDELRRDRGLALLFITHDLELAGAVCDRTAVMYAGPDRRAARVVARCTTTRCIRTPRRSSAARPRIDGDRAIGSTAIPGRPLSAFEAPAGLRVRDPLRVRRRTRCRAARPPLERARRRAGALHARRRAARRLAARMATPCRCRGPVLEVDGLRKEFGDAWSPSTT